MADMKYELYDPRARKAEVDARLLSLEQEHYVLVLDEDSGIPMGRQSHVSIGGTTMPAKVPGADFAVDASDNPEDRRKTMIAKYEKAIIELRKEQKALEAEIKSQSGE